MKKAIITLLLLLPIAAQAQSLKLFDIDTTDYPVIRAKIWAFDENGKQITNLSPSDFEITEDGVLRDVISVSCPEQQPANAVSSVLSFDISASMLGENMSMAKKAGTVWINGLSLGINECAITSFDLKNYLNQDFTTNKDKLLNALNSLQTLGSTNFDAGFIDPMAGALLVAEKGDLKRVVVFLTDGIAKGDEYAIIDKANEINATVFCVTLNMPCPEILKNISEKTGGEWFDNIISASQAEAVYQSILQTVRGGKPCEIEWHSRPACSRTDQTIVEMELSVNQSQAVGHYNTPYNSVANLEINPPYIKFTDPDIGVENYRQITITARNADFDVSNIKVSNSDYDISPKSFFLAKDQSKILDVSYTPAGKDYSYCKFTIENDICEQDYSVSGQHSGGGFNKNYLKLTHPNGGENIYIGSDYLITWEGILPCDTIGLTLSRDNGNSWEIIDNNATNLSYSWNNIFGPESEKCLIKAVYGATTRPRILWEKNYGGSLGEQAESIIELKDGNLIVVGRSESKDGNVSENHGEWDYWIVKINPDNRSIIWERSYGGSKWDYAQSIIEMKDGSLAVAGYSWSQDGDVSGNHGGLDCWILKLDQTDGSIIWKQSFGGSNYDFAESIIETNDGNLVFAGFSSSDDGDITESHGKHSYWIVKLNSGDGKIIWNKSFGGSEWDEAYDIIEMKDGSLAVAGKSNSSDGDVTGNHAWADYWILKLNPNDGSLIWEKSLGGSSDDIPASIIQLNDDALVVAGYSTSSNGDVKGNHGDFDYWIVKLEPTDGSIIWERSLGGTSADYANSVIGLEDCSIVVGGYSYSTDGDVTDSHGDFDFWITKLEPADGSIIWEKTLGGSADDRANALTVLTDKSFLIAGYSYSNDGDPGNNYGLDDFWIVKLTEPQPLLSDTSDAVFSIFAPHAVSRDIDMKQVLVGITKDSVVKEFIMNTGLHPCRIDSIYIRGADAGAFSLVSGFPVYTVNISENHSGEFRFRPTETRIYEAEIVIITQNDTLFQAIRGEGIEPRLQIVNKLIDFGQVRLGEYRDTLDVLTIKNTGTNPIDILSTNHSWPNDVDFTTRNGAGPFTLQPGEEWPMTLRFTPGEAGRTSGILEFHYTGVGSPETIQLFGEGYSKPEIDTAFTNFENLDCESKDYRNFNIINTGAFSITVSEIYLSGSNPGDFQIDINLPLIIEPGSTETIAVEFAPQEIGVRSAELNIISDAVNFPLVNYTYSARKDSVALNWQNIEIDFGTIRTNRHIDTTIIIGNNGTIANTGLISGNSEFNIDKDAVRLNAGESGEITISYSGSPTPTSLDEELVLTDSICGRQSNIRIKANIEALATASVRLADIQAMPESKIVIPIVLDAENDIGNSGIETISVDFIYNPTVLYPLDYSQVYLSNDEAKIRIDGLNILANQGDTLRNIRFSVGLGNSENSVLRLSNPEYDDSIADITLIDGTFTLLGVCREGGARLINPDIEAGIINISPNPAEKSLNIEISLIEEGQTELSIFNSFGESVKSVFSANNETTGVKKFKADISNLANGVYYVILKTPNQHFIEKVLVIR